MRNIPRLEYGFLSQSLDPVNVKIPWSLSVKDGMFKMNYSQDKAVLDNLKFWANTNKGEYVADLNFGLDVRRNLFNPIDSIKDILEQNTREQIPIYFPELGITRIEVFTSEDNSEINDNAIIFKFVGFLKIDSHREIVLEEVIGI